MSEGSIITRRGSSNLEHLTSIIRTGKCVLFLGAGVSVDSDAPDGRTLAVELRNEFFPNLDEYFSLDTVVSYIDTEYTRRKLRIWLVERFKDLTPKGALQIIPKYKWRSIYTTNFDTLLERAYDESPDAIQKLHPIYSDKDRIEDLRVDEVPYYKLHGCLSRDAAAAGSLILTQSDFANAESGRRRFFDRLYSEMIEFNVFYVGFRHSDPDFWKVFTEVEHAVGGFAEVPRSFALRSNFSNPEEQTWAQKRVSLLDARAGEFFSYLEESTIDGVRFIPPESIQPKASSSLIVRCPRITPTMVIDVERNFEVVDERIHQQLPNIEEFFLGAPPNWGIFGGETDARRDITDDIVATVLDDPHLDTGTARLALIHAEAGAGKTTLLRRLAVELAITWSRMVIFLKPVGELDFLSVERLVATSGERIYVFVDEAASNAKELSSFLAEAAISRSRITVIAASRTNEWNEIKGEFSFPKTDQFTLSTLSSTEINGVLDTLAKHNALGLLAGTDKTTQVQAFESRAQKQLLVALREATEGRNFEDIIVSEFDRIPGPNGARAYLLVAALHRLGIQTRAGVLRRALRIPYADLKREVFDPTERIIVTNQSLGESDTYYSTRHQAIADIVFDRKIPSERRKLDYYSDILQSFDLGFASDLDAFRKLSRSKNTELLRGFHAPDSKRTLMNQLIELDPEDAYVHQHAAIMEMKEGNLQEAGKYLRRALELLPGNTSILDTQGRLTMLTASRETDLLKAERLFALAEDTFGSNIQRRPDEPYGYRHLAETYIRWSRKIAEEETKLRYVKLAYDTLLKGIDKCASVGMLLQYQAVLEDQYIGNVDRAREILGKALVATPGDLPIRFMAASIDRKSGNNQKALDLLLDGLNHNAMSHSLHFRIVELLLETLPTEEQRIKSHFEAAILGPQRNYFPRMMYAAFLFSLAEYDRAREQFAVIDSLQLTTESRTALKHYSFRGLGALKFGRVNRLSYTYSTIEYDGGAYSVYFPYRRLESGVQANITIGSRVSFKLAFNTRGPIAEHVRLAD